MMRMMLMTVVGTMLVVIRFMMLLMTARMVIMGRRIMLIVNMMAMMLVMRGCQEYAAPPAVRQISYINIVYHR